MNAAALKNPPSPLKRSSKNDQGAELELKKKKDSSPLKLETIGGCGFEHPSEVQHECIPQAILGMDVVCQGASGTAQTGLLMLMTLKQLNPADGEVSVVCMCHSHRVASRIAKDFELATKALPEVKVAVFSGKMDIKKDVERLANDSPHIVIGTPGRMHALFRKNMMKLDKVKYFILDDADKLIGYKDMRLDVQGIVKMAPQPKQVLIFTDCLTNKNRKACYELVKKPIQLYVQNDILLSFGHQHHHLIRLDKQMKYLKLQSLLAVLEFNQVVIFVGNESNCQHVCNFLSYLALGHIFIHEELQDEARISRYQAFKDFQKTILVATDLFGRGIDIERVNIVINFDAPKDPDSYLHRVARGGLFGAKGLAISFVSDQKDVEVLNSVQDRFDISITELPEKVDGATYM